MDIAQQLERELDAPEFPLAVSHLWSAWGRMRRRKASGMNGHEPIEWPDIDAFVRLTGLRFAPWEINLIETIDDLFLETMAQQAKQMTDEIQQGKGHGK